MTVEELIIEGKKHIHSHEVKMLLASVLNYDTLELLTHLDEIVGKEACEKFKNLVQARKDNYPLQYIIGDVNFYGRKFIVNENVLIPRFETEELIEKTLIKIKEVFADDNIAILDIGTGSGAIGITIKAILPNSHVTCSDISKSALNVAKINAENLNQEISFIQSDIFEKIESKFDLIISNPPYIDKEEEIEAQVFKHEPHLALFAKEKGTAMYRQILSEAKRYLKERYLLAFEIGVDQKEVLKTLQKEYFPKAEFECIKDLSDKDRIVLIYESK